MRFCTVTKLAKKTEMEITSFVLVTIPITFNHVIKLTINCLKASFLANLMKKYYQNPFGCIQYPYGLLRNKSTSFYYLCMGTRLFFCVFPLFKLKNKLCPNMFRQILVDLFARHQGQAPLIKCAKLHLH